MIVQDSSIKVAKENDLDGNLEKDIINLGVKVLPYFSFSVQSWSVGSDLMLVLDKLDSLSHERFIDSQ